MTIARHLFPQAHWLLRLAVAPVFLFHGITRMGQTSDTEFMTGFTPALVQMLAGIEILAGVLVIVGGLTLAWFTRLGAGLMILVNLLLIAAVHWPRWSFICTMDYPWGGMEFRVTLLLVAGYLLLKGNRYHGPPFVAGDQIGES